MKRAVAYILLVIILLFGLRGSAAPPGDAIERVRAFTRSQEFDYAGWMVDALAMKDAQAALNAPGYLPESRQTQVVRYYLALVERIRQLEAAVQLTYSDPDVENPEAQSAGLREELDLLRAFEKQLSPVVEAILQQQVSAVLADLGLAVAGQPLPPVLYHVTDLPLALIISPRTVIRQDANISLQPGLTLEQRMELENAVEQGLDLSALVVNVGGVGVYPPMVLSSTDLPYLVDTIAHEWTHNYLTLRPLGIRYDASPALRTMNETTASIAGNEIGQAVLARFYPDLYLPPEPEAPPREDRGERPDEEPPAFDFQAVMHETRVTADRLLAEGKVAEAEAYMEQRRQLLWEHGYHIRKLNQAYFAFYGAYAATPGGAAGADPVGPAVRALRAESRSLAQFVRRISWMTSFDALQRAVQN